MLRGSKGSANAKSRLDMKLILLVAIIAAAVQIYRWRSATVDPPALRAAAAGPKSEGDSGKAKRRAASTSESADPATLTAKAVIEKERIAGLRSILLIEEGGDFRLSVTVRVKPQCRIGDLDLMSIETLAEPSSRVIVSVEPMIEMVGWDYARTTRIMSFKDFAVGGSHVFKVSKSAGSIPLGVFVCRDEEHLNHCRGKATLTPGQVYESHKVLMTARSKAEVRLQDRVYYFQYVQIQTGALKMLPRRELLPEDYQRVGSFLTASVDQRLRPRELATQVRQVHQAVGSYPIEIKNGAELEVVLPRSVAKLCDPRTAAASGAEEPPSDYLINGVPAALSEPTGQPMSGYPAR